MMSSQLTQSRRQLLCLPLFFIAIGALQARIDANTGSANEAREELLLRSGAVIQKLSLGYNSLLADIYWTRAVQYYGGRVGMPNAKFDLLWPLLDVTTTLDPGLIPAYRFGAIFLSEPGNVGAGRTDLAIQLVKRGIAANPEEWRLGTDLGFLYYWRTKDYPNAAAAYLATSRNPKAPPWVKVMAARIEDKGGSLETSRMIWREIHESTKDPVIKNDAARQLQSLAALDDEIHLDVLVDQYRRRFGHWPASFEQIRTAGLLPGIPVDPVGVPYVLGSNGKSRLNPASPIANIPGSTNPAR
jgi:hypothetical protein